MTPKTNPMMIRFEPINSSRKSTHHGADGVGQMVRSSPLAGAGRRKIHQSNDGCAPLRRCLGHPWPAWARNVPEVPPGMGPNRVQEQTIRRHIYIYIYCLLYCLLDCLLNCLLYCLFVCLLGMQRCKYAMAQ